MEFEFTAEGYVDDVLNGRVVVCRWVRLACERHRRDLERGHERGLWFDERAAKVAVAFFGVLRHWKGEWAGRPVVLEPAQQFWIWSLFGWKRQDGSRRFRTGYLEVARKNGKTLLAAGVGLYLAFVEGEPGAEVYSAATTREQAKICHNDATKMVERSPQLGEIVSIYRNNLHDLGSGSKFEPLSSDHNTLDGLNVHGAICDELHAWLNRQLWGVLKTGTGSRRQPLMLAITTAGVDQQGVCYSQREYVTRILRGIVEDDAYWGIIYSLDTKKDWADLRVRGKGIGQETGPEQEEETGPEQSGEGVFEDDWGDEAVWVKANPLLGVSKKWDAMREGAREARNKPAELNGFLRWHFNLWLQAVTRWVNPIKWAACGALPDDGLSWADDAEGFLEAFRRMLGGRRAYAGLDLSSIYDITALVLVIPPVAEDEPHWVLPRFYIPAENILERVERANVPYDVWVRQGCLVATPGEVVDYDFVLNDLGAWMEVFELEELAFDRWGSTKVTNDLQNDFGFTTEPKVAELQGAPLLLQFGQGYASMNWPMKELAKLISSGGLAHGNHPVLNWMADNLVAREDPAGNLKPDKEKSREKIDGMVALIMGLARALHGGGRKGSVYRERGIRVL